MELSQALIYLLFAAISLLSAAAAVVVTGHVQTRVLRRPGARPVARAQEVARPSVGVARSYEFQDGALVSAIGTEDAFLEADTDPRRAFSALCGAFATMHPDLADRMGALARRGEAFFLVGYLGPDALSVAGRVVRDRLVVTVTPVADEGGRRTVDAQSLQAMEQETEDLRRALALSAAVQWKETAEGRVIWADPAYLGLAERATGRGAGDLGWPLPRVFGEQLDPRPPEGSLRRCRVPLVDREEPAWFEVAAQECRGGGALFSARPIDRLVAAEGSLRDLVQTLSKTFAALPIGLAVFDRKRELVMFNPALVAITTLDPGYLSGRPTLRAFLDQLRDRRRMPEPRNYRSWRDEIARLEAGAEAGTYQDLWTLPCGESLRLTGRPHPDGAVAFMFEDISKEISVTRRFRAEIDLFEAILDDTAAAFVVFGRDGQVVRTNAAFDAMWPQLAAGTSPSSLIEAATIWQEAHAPTGLWGEIRDFAAHEVDRAAWSETVIATGGHRALCRVAPLRGGHTIVWFLSVDAATADPMAAWLPEVDPTRADLAGEATARANGRHGEGAA
jgi:PAS domain-containing protein